MTVWQARTGGLLQGAFQQFSSSVEEDAAFVLYDIQGSIAHVQGLQEAGLITSQDAAALTAGLEQIGSEFEAGTWILDPALEDVHMNIEATLTARLGDVGKRLHTGRSRNDQVATCITLFARDALAALGGQLLDVSHTLAKQAETHKATPWVARTHGQPAQPATLGFLLAAHAHRFADAAQHVFWTARHVAVSPLGSGAIAGSTLPLDPAFTAEKLGLQPPKNALLATGSRDTILAVLERTSHIGLLASSLAQDLFDLITIGAVRIDPGLTTGSSLMPQKRNPDAIELVRGHARALPAHQQAVQALCMPLGLGYMRDLQVSKPHLVYATDTAGQVLSILMDAVASLTVHEATLVAQLATPGIGATDAAEALVLHDVPFRTAYNVLAAAHQEGADPVAVVSASELSDGAKADCIAALAGDVQKRDTLGGPAPQAVEASLQHLDVILATLEAQHQALVTVSQVLA